VENGESIEVDPETLAAIDHALEAVKQGRVIPLENVRRLIPGWISKFESLPGHATFLKGR
jgi:hypothetical protein